MRSIPSNISTAALRRIPFTLVDATDLKTPEDISVSSVKATLTFDGGTPASSTNDIVKVNGTNGEYYLELTQTEANQTAGTMVRGYLTPSGCALTKFQAQIGPSTLFGTPDVNVTQISGDSTAADNLEAMLDGTGGVTLSAELPTTERNALADAYLDRDMSVGTDSGSSTVRTPRQALRTLRNKVTVAGGTATVTKEDDATTSFTAAITGTPAVTGINPAGGS